MATEATIHPGSKPFRYGTDHFAMLCRRVEPFQSQLATHGVYKRVQSLTGLRTFMSQHVFAVWDFMTLVKSLQRTLTCVETPWLPPEQPLAARLVNEIVLGEESDGPFDGEYLSHYTLYLRSMGEIGADPKPMLQLEEALRIGVGIEQALAALPVPEPTRRFVLSTIRAAQGQTHEVAASLLLAREDLIPVMFDRVLREMDKDSALEDRLARGVRNLGDKLPTGIRARLSGATKRWGDEPSERKRDPRFNFRTYLRRHVQLDGEEHGPMGRQMLELLCGDDQTRWQQATNAARAALEARIALWDGVLVAIERESLGQGAGFDDPERYWYGRDLAGWLEEQRAEAVAAAEPR